MNLHDLIYLGQRLTDSGQTWLRAESPGVPVAEFLVMRDVLDHGPSTVTQIAHRTGYAQSRVSTAVAGLRERRWVQTYADTADGRHTLVDAPPEQRATASQLRARSAEPLLEHLLADLPKRRRETIRRALDELLDQIRRRETNRPLLQPAT